jgi:hypothetical protein
MEKVYLVGNELVKEDSLPIELKEDLSGMFPNILFEEFDPTENLPEDSSNLVLIDTVMGISVPVVFTDIDVFSSKKAYSMHDFDLGWQLKLYKKLKMIEKVSIIGIPMGMEKTLILEKIKPLIESLFPVNL